MRQYFGTWVDVSIPSTVNHEVVYQFLLAPLEIKGIITMLLVANVFCVLI
jgi:hypothetical protein